MADNSPDILLAFLRSPLSRAAFNGFFDLTYRRTLACLRSLRSQGYRLPLDDRTDSDPLSNLAIDVLGEVMAPVQGRLCPGLFDYLRRQGFHEFGSEDAERLDILYRGFLRGRIRQRLSRLRGEVDPEIENLKRRVRDVLKELGLLTAASGRTLAGPLPDDSERPHPGVSVAAVDLRRIVEESFLCTTTRKAWCSEIFRRLAETGEYSPLVPLHELLAAMVEVNARFLEGDEFAPAPLPGPEQELLKDRIAAARTSAIEQVCVGTLRRFVAKGRLTEAEGPCIRLALERYLEDFATNGDTDKIPDYFRECMPAETHSRYLDDYKYVFESILAEGVARLRVNLSQDRQ